MSNELKESKFLLYETDEGNININVILKDEDIWLTQKGMAELFDVEQPAIAKHLINIYNDEELFKDSTYSKMELVQKEGNRNVKRNIEFYNLDAIIAVGYRVNSKEATNFRRWATEVLKSYIIKGWAVNKERLKNPNKFGKDYFDDLLEVIKEIRTSKRRLYQKVTDIFAECSIDYNPKNEIAINFFATIQNKFHYAITGETAAEIIYHRADSQKVNMGLTSWKKSPTGRIQKSDVVIAKNYLEEKELEFLQDIVNMYLDIAENRAKRQIIMKMKDWTEELNIMLKTNRYEILQNNGSISEVQAKNYAENEYAKYRVIADKKYISDFDKIIEDIKKK